MAVISQLVHYGTFSHFLAHGFLALYKHFPGLCSQLSHVIVMDLLECISGVVVPLTYVDW